MFESPTPPVTLNFELARIALREQINWVLDNIITTAHETPRCLVKTIKPTAINQPLKDGQVPPVLPEFIRIEPIISTNTRVIDEIIHFLPWVLLKYEFDSPLIFMFADRSDEMMMRMRWG